MLRRGQRKVGCMVAVLSVLAASYVFADDNCDSDGQCRAPWPRQTCAKPFGQLHPSDLPPPVVFSNWTRQYNVTLGGREITASEGMVPQINNLENGSDSTSIEAKVYNLPQVLDAKTVKKMLKLLNEITLDSDPDTVDGMPTYEVFIESPDLRRPPSGQSLKDVLEIKPDTREQRVNLRRELKKMMIPALEKVLTPFIRQTFSNVCNSTKKGPSRACTPCYSLIRNYRHGSRSTHAAHYDGHAIVTAVVSLSDYGTEYVGGLYVATGHGDQQYLSLSRGDAAVHDTTLLHGVKVHDLPDNPEKTQRWSWILWYKDSTDCEDHSHEWFSDCSAAGDPMCQQLHSTKVGNIPGIDGSEVATQVMQLNMKAAQQGAGLSAIKVARAYLKQLPSELPFNMKEAKRYFELAIASHNPDGHFGMATLFVSAAASNDDSLTKKPLSQDKKLARAVKHLESAAYQGHAFAMFNLGLAHIYGYGVGAVDLARGAEWLVQSGLPEGYFAASHHAAAVGDRAKQARYKRLAEELGYFEHWRVEARERTGSGGAGGVDINLPWPPSKLRGGMKPPRF